MKTYTSQEIKEFISKPLFDERIILNKNQNYPKISIVTASYNQVKFLEKTILSVLNQNYPNLEYVIIDGGSTDGSIEIIKKYEKYLTYWVSEKDEGPSDAVNKGFKKTSGEILGLLNSDDLYLPGILLKIKSVFVKDDEIKFVYGHTISIDEKDDIIRVLYTAPQTYRSYIYDKTGNVFLGSTFWKREIFFKCGMVDRKLQYAQEYKLFTTFFKNERGYFLNDPLAAARTHNEQRQHKIPPGVMLVELESINYPSKINFVLNICYRSRRILYYFIYGNLLSAIKGKIRSFKVCKIKE